MRLGLIIACVILANGLFAQRQTFLHFIPQVEDELLQANSEVTSIDGVGFSVEVFNYYLSNLHIIGDQEILYQDSVFLIKIKDYVIDLGLQNITNVNQVSFGAGVVGNLNHLDISQYVETHPLSFQDPSMQWGWTAGYAHMIVDGLVDANGDLESEYTFQLHNLGDLNYHQVEVTPFLIETQDTLHIYVYCNLDEWLYGIQLKTVGIVHGSTGVNTDVMSNVLARNVFSGNSTASTSDNKLENGKVSAYQTGTNLTVSWSELNEASSYTLHDMSGKLISSGEMDKSNGACTFNDLSKGVYLFTCFSASKDQIQQLRIAY